MPGGHARRNAERHAAALAEARARHRAAGQKVSRMNRKGVRTGGIDPRRNARELSGMSTRELRAYTRQLNKFTGRSTQYVPGKRGTPIAKSKWDRYKQLEVTYNAKTETFESIINKIKIAPVGLTVEQRRKRMTPDDPISAGAARRTFEKIDRRSTGVESESALDKLTKDMQRRVSPNYMDREMKATREQLNDMVTQIGDSALREKLDKLTNEQLIVLVDGTEFMKRLGGIYEQAKSSDTDRPEWQTTAVEDSISLVHEYADWAGTLNPKLEDFVTRSDDTRPGRGSKRR